ncbi:hypothetical protein GJ496_002954 [Pomphorhynchus laevis]|nr:hypothetical protein GJ496_002954 [Pomphorhynchus laevis]
MLINDVRSLRKCRKESRKLNVGNLPDNVDDSILKPLFERYGKILDIKYEQEDANSQKITILDRTLVTCFHLPGNPIPTSFLHAMKNPNAVTDCNNFDKLNTEKVVSCCSASKQIVYPTTIGTNDNCSVSKLTSSTICDFQSSESLGSPAEFATQSVIVSNLPSNLAELCVRERVYYKFKRYGNVCAVKINTVDNKRTAIIKFDKSEDAINVHKELNGQICIWDSNLPFEMYNKEVSSDADMLLEESIIYSDRATRTLYAGNLPSGITEADLRVLFESFGDIWLIDIKRHNNVTPYAFVYFDHIRCVARTMRIMNGQQYQRYTLKLGFGRGQQSKTLWLGSLPRGTTIANLSEFTSVRTEDIILESYLREAIIMMADVSTACGLIGSSRKRKFLNQYIEIDYAPKEFLNCTVFGNLVTKLFPSNDCFDLICKDNRKRILKDVAGGSELINQVFSERISVEGSKAEIISKAVAYKNGIVHLTPAENRDRLSLADSNKFDETHVEAARDVDLRFLLPLPSTTSDSVVVIHPEKRLNLDHDVNKDIKQQSPVIDNNTLSFQTQNLHQLKADVNAMMQNSLDRLTYLQLCRSRFSSQRHSKFNQSTILGTGCLNKNKFCKCSCLWFLYGDRLFAFNVFKKMFCGDNSALIKTSTCMSDQLLNTLSMSRKYCIAMLDHNLCCRKLNLPIMYIFDQSISVYLMDQSNKIAHTLKLLSDCDLSTYNDYLIVVFVR